MIEVKDFTPGHMNQIDLSLCAAERLPEGVKKLLEEVYPDFSKDVSKFKSERLSIKPSEETRDLLKKLLDAKKAVFQSAEGKKLLMDAYADELKWETASRNDIQWFVKAAQETSTIPELMNSVSASPEAFAEILKENRYSLGVKKIINQAMELSYLEGSSFEKTLRESLIRENIPEHAAEVFTKIASAHGRGELEVHMTALHEQHGAEAKKILEERTARFEHGFEHERIKIVEEAPLGSKATQLETEIEETLSKAKRWSPGGKWAAGIAAAAAVAGGGWVLYEHNRSKEKSVPKYSFASR